MFVSVSTRRPTFPPLLRNSMFLWTRRLQTSMLTVSCRHRNIRNIRLINQTEKLSKTLQKPSHKHLRVAPHKPSSQRSFQTFNAVKILILNCSKRATITLNIVLHWKCYFSIIRKKYLIIECNKTKDSKRFYSSAHVEVFVTYYMYVTFMCFSCSISAFEMEHFF